MSTQLKMLNHSFNIKFRHLSLGVAPREAALTQLLCWLCPASVFLDCFTDWVPVGDGGETPPWFQT